MRAKGSSAVRAQLLSLFSCSDTGWRRRATGLGFRLGVGHPSYFASISSVLPRLPRTFTATASAAANAFARSSFPSAIGHPAAG